MSDDNKVYVDPSSGAAPQPGAVYPGAFETDEDGAAKLKDVPLNELRQPTGDGKVEAATSEPKEAPKEEAPKEEAPKEPATKKAASKETAKGSEK